MKIVIGCLLLACCLTALVVSPRPAAAQQTAAARRETITGTMVGIGGTRPSRSTGFTLTITGTTSDQDVQRYVGILAERGQDAALGAVKNQKLGTFALTGQLGRDVNVVRISPTENGGRRITLFFERWLNLYEVRYGTRSQDYPFSYAEIYVDAQGKGEGTFIPAARVRFDKDNQSVEVENFGIYPARLLGVRAR